jgi:hypothetical protein
MKKKVKKFADGNVVRTRTDDEIVEDNKNPYGRYTPKTKEYSLDDVKSGIGRLFGGKSGSTEKSSNSEDRPKSDGVQDYASLGKRFGSMPAKSTWDGSPNIKEEPKEEPTRKISDYINKDVTTTDEKAIERDVMDVEPKKKAASRPTQAVKRQYEPDSKPIKETPALPPAKMANKKVEPKPLPGKPEPKSKVTPYSAPNKISKEEEAEGERGKRMEEEAAAQLEKNKKETKPSAPVKKGEYYRDFSGKLKKKTPDDRRPLKDLGETVAEGAKSVGEFASKNIKTPAQRRDEEKSVRKNQTQYGMKKGGSVSSASSRGDGIAQRGKTRGRIY